MVFRANDKVLIKFVPICHWIGTNLSGLDVETPR